MAALLFRAIHLGAGLNKLLHDLWIALKGRIHEGGPAMERILVVHLGAGLEELLYGVGVAFRGRIHQRCSGMPVGVVGVRASREESLHEVGVAFVGCMDEGRLLCLIGGVWRHAGFQEQRDHRLVPVLTIREERLFCEGDAGLRQLMTGGVGRRRLLGGGMRNGSPAEHQDQREAAGQEGRCAVHGTSSCLV